MKTIVWDIDDVLNDCMRSWLLGCWLPAHPDCRATYAGLHQNPPHALLGVRLEEYLESLDGFRLSAAARAMRPDERLLGWFRNSGRHFRHIALTARPGATVHPAFEWVLCHYGEWFQTFSFVPSHRPGEPPAHPDRGKGEFLSWLRRADYFIDDDPANVRTARELGVEAFLVSRPWNRGGRPLARIVETLLIR